MRAFNDHSYIQLNSKFTQSDQEIVSSASISASLGKNETEVETADRLDYQRIHQASLRENETKGEQKVRLKSMTSTYEKKKTLQSKRYLNIAKSHISSEVCDTLIDQQSIVSMTYHCSYCHAKFWEGEKLSTSTKEFQSFPPVVERAR
eukprot:TRINITY_DN974_c0_g1_i11.p1 TRINITY_DN974_c0_g1~~TRINITY_DN974_c0_g1_i11.p1  ORF type:complete len:148 (+),score=17.99 TRINITY_DN974_c0_g1_i11:56-499(+)